MHGLRVSKPSAHYQLLPMKRNVASRVVGTPASQFLKLVWKPVFSNFKICHVPLQSLETSNGKYSDLCYDCLLPSRKGKKGKVVPVLN
jgi:hypothetical protein